MARRWLVAVIVTVWFVHPAHASAPLPSGLNATLRWQYECASAVEALALLESPGWLNWIADDCGQSNHTPMAYTMLPSNLAGYVADVEDGEFWLIGNEPNIGASHVSPGDAALFSRGWVTQTRPGGSRPFACCGTLQHYEHPDLLGWLDDYLAAGGEVGDAWHLHIYFVGNGGWDATLAQFEAWMAANDVVRPVIVSETGQTSGNAEPLLRHVAQAVCDERVQAAYWYPADRDAYGFAVPSQLTIDGAITPLGEVFVQLQDCPTATPEPTATPTATPVPTPTPAPTVGPQASPWRVWLPLVSG